MASAGAAVRLLADDPDAELARLAGASDRMQRGIDELIAGCMVVAGDGGGARATCWRPTGWSRPMPAGCAGCAR